MEPFPTEDSGGLAADSVDVAAMCAARGWSRTRLIGALRRAAAVDGRKLPSDDSLRRMIRLWVSGKRTPSHDYAALIARAFGVAQFQHQAEQTNEFLELLDRADSTIDADLVTALEAQTQSLRVLDRRIGARRLLTQAEAHAQNVSDLVQWAPFGHVRDQLAAAGAEAAALAGWQALDLGRPKASWRQHTLARALAQESGEPSVIAHVSTQQAYALLDAARPEQAVSRAQAARTTAGSKVPPLVQAWLAAAEAEAQAAAGDETEALRLLDQADRTLSNDEAVPFIVLDAAHLARWRGHCLARLGHPDAIDTLNQALDVLEQGFNRAGAGLHADLATAHAANGDSEATQHYAQLAARLSATAGSQRQSSRARALLNPERE